MKLIDVILNKQILLKNHKKRILLINNEILISKLLGFLLKSEYDFVIKNDEDEAVSWLNTGLIPDLIISNIQIENFKLVEFFLSSYLSGFNKNVPQIVLTDSSLDFYDAFKNVSGNNDHVLVKPFHPADLKFKIESLLN